MKPRNKQAEQDWVEFFTERGVMKRALHFSGVKRRARICVNLNGWPYGLRLKSFKYLLALAVARFATAEGWIHQVDIEPGENQIKYIWQLRHELDNSPAFANLIENDGCGSYRLALSRDAISFDLARLRAHPDWEIRSRAEIWLKQLAAVTGGRGRRGGD